LKGVAGRRVVVTRAGDQASELATRLEEAGAIPVVFSTIELVDPSDGGASLMAAAARASAYDWIVFTSSNAVGRTAPHLTPGRTARIAAVGPGTAAALSEAGLVPDLVATRHVAEGLLDEMPQPPGAGGKVRALLPQAAGARDVLAEGLRAMGYQVDVVEAYRTVTRHPVPDELAALAGAGADAITFTSSSTVKGFLDTAGRVLVPPVVACIGPVTAATAEEMGLLVDIVAEEHTVVGLVAALADFAGWPPLL
jgi:uroporphyrinogen-III synthase